MPRRVRRPKDKEPVLTALVNEPEGGPFTTFREVLVFAAALGVASNRRVPFEPTSEPIPWEVFGNTATPTMDMIAAVTTEEPEILGDDRIDDRLTIFEEYANGGLEIIRERLANDPRPALDVVLDIVLDHEGGTGMEAFDLEGILR
jgi:dnd system-associated protein 4